MCTLTWQQDGAGYRLLFNRDERATRPAADPPAVHENSGVAAIMPRDSLAGGTWISVNSLGLTFCLINNYGAEERRHDPHAPSRGKLAKELAYSRSRERALDRFMEMDPTSFNPFDFFIFDTVGSVTCMRWDGLQLEQTSPSEPFAFSSGFDQPGVVGKRRTLFYQWQQENRDLADYHRSHIPEAGSYSVCMHRGDAGTQSLSEVRVEPARVSFSYTPGPPCTTQPLPSLEIARRGK